MTIMGTLRRAKSRLAVLFEAAPHPTFDALFHPDEGDAPQSQAPQSQGEPLVILFKPPAGGPWFPLWDAGLNAHMELSGRGWRNYEAIEIWRETLPRPAAILTHCLKEQAALNVTGLYWRPLAHVPVISQPTKH